MEVAAEWSELSGCFYRVTPVAALQWEEIDLSQHIVACAPNGGPIAVAPHPHSQPPTPSRADGMASQFISVFTAAGRPLSHFRWDPVAGSLLAMGWREHPSHGLLLVCCSDEGSVFQHTMHGEFLPPKLSLCSNGPQSLLEAAVFAYPTAPVAAGSTGSGGTGAGMAAGAAAPSGGAAEGAEGEGGEASGGGCAGVVAVTNSLEVVLLTDFDAPQVVSVADCGLKEPPVCFVALPEAASAAGAGAFVLLGTEEGQLLRADADGVEPVLLPGMAAPQRLAASSSGRLVALFADDGRLHVAQAAQLQQPMAEFPTRALLAPDALAWCGEDAVLLFWRHPRALLLVGPGGGVRFLLRSGLEGEGDDEEEEDLLEGGEGEEEEDIREDELGAIGAGGRRSAPLKFVSAAGPIAAVPLAQKGRREGRDGAEEGSPASGTTTVVLVAERDGCRVVGSRHADIISRVPQPLVEVFQVGGTAPAALLWEAHQLFQQKSPKEGGGGGQGRERAPQREALQATRLFAACAVQATLHGIANGDGSGTVPLCSSRHQNDGRCRVHELVRAMSADDMADAVAGCMAAACHEWSIQRQQQLLAAAVFGRAFASNAAAASAGSIILPHRLTLQPGCFAGDRPADCRKLPRDAMSRLCRDLRVLNAVRRSDRNDDSRGRRGVETAGMALTYAQYKALGAARLIVLLCAAHQHLLALRIATSLGLPAAPVLERWAAAKVAACSQVPDKSLFALLLRQIESDRKAAADVSFASIADVAFRLGRKELAVLLAGKEAQPSRQVLLLLRVGEAERALDCAVAGSDADLLLRVILQLLLELPEPALFDLVRPRPLAFNALAAYGRRLDVGLLLRLYQHCGMQSMVAETLLQQVAAAVLSSESTPEHTGGPDAAKPLRSSGSGFWGGASLFGGASAAGGHAEGAAERGAGGSSPGGWMSEAVREMEGAGELFSRSKESAFEARAVEEGVRLLRAQRALEQALLPAASQAGKGLAAFALSRPPAPSSAAHGLRLEGLSLHSTVAALVAQGHHREAQKLRADFRVSDRHFYFIKLRVLVEAKDWEALNKFATERKPPIGYRPFVEACAEAGATDEAAKYVAKINDPHEREELYKRLNMEEAAAEAAAAAANEGLLMSALRSTFGTTSAVSSEQNTGSIFGSFAR